MGDLQVANITMENGKKNYKYRIDEQASQSTMRTKESPSCLPPGRGLAWLAKLPSGPIR